ncbi:MAG: alpha/beta fold hydrolase [Thermoanaerobaculia bacterium]|nr:alpha/beta fold hydrolase [Thermoanaerobaculia bacterium]
MSAQPGAFVPYAANHSFTEPNRRITRILFSIHGRGFDAFQYYKNAEQAASRAPDVLGQTLIVAPQFYEQKVIPGAIPDGLLFWRTSPFRGSVRSAIGPDVKVISLSAYAVIDEWLGRLVDSGNFPNVREIVLVGHSAGGQLVQRYAMVGKYQHDEIQFRYVVSAPSSYAYPSPERYNVAKRTFVVPDATTIERCPRYDHWGYGLEEPYRYFADIDSQAIVESYSKKRVFYLVGEKDADHNDESLSKVCGAMLQGAHRLQRMLVFQSFLEFKYGKPISQFHKFEVVPKVGHYGFGTMTSPAGLRALFAPLR